MSNGNTNNLAERIALLLQENERGDDLAALRAGLDRINERLDKIEAQIQNPTSKIQNPEPLHFSQQRFLSLEELADQIIDSRQTEKPCPYEPTAKPCDNCSMCSSRGF